VLDSHSTKGRVRVLHLITDAGPHPYFELVGAHADRQRFDVRLATLGAAGALHADADRMQLPSYALGAVRRSQYPRAAIALARLMRRQQIDVVQTHLLDGSVIGLLAARLARVPVAIFTGHHSHEIPLHNRWSLTAVDRLCSGTLCDAVISPSQQMRDTFVQFHGVPPEKVKVVPHGFELEKLDPGSVDRSAVRAELELDGRTVITSIGRVYWIKNQAALVHAFARVTKDDPDAVLLLVGAGEYSSVRELARSLGVQDRVRTLPARGDVPALLAASDLFVHPALAESFAMVIVEAMAMACPVVSTPVGIAPDVVDDGRTGVLATGGAVDALTEALRTALSMRDSWPDWGAAARARALDFPADGMVRSYEALYLELLKSSRRRYREGQSQRGRRTIRTSTEVARVAGRTYHRPMSASQARQAVDVHSEQAAMFAARYGASDPYGSAFTYSRMRLDRSLDRTLPPTDDGLRLLDVGCGTGHQMVEWAARGYSVSGVDGSAEMLMHARRNNPDAELREAQVDALPFDTAAFDAITCIEVLRYLPDPTICIREMARVLKPGGICLATATPLLGMNGYALVNRLAVAVPIPRVTRLKQFFTTTSQLRRQFVEAGFTDVRVQGVYLGPIIWVERLLPKALPRLLRWWERYDERLADRPLLRDLSNMYLVQAVRAA